MLPEALRYTLSKAPLQVSPRAGQGAIRWPGAASLDDPGQRND
jgi:hypothetical protein